MMKAETIVPIVTALVIYLVRMQEVMARRATIAGERKETLTLKLFMLCGVLIIVCGIVEFLVLRPAVNWTIEGLGVVLSVAALVLRRWAIRTLGIFWSLHVELRADQQLLTAGPFRFVRHPVYLGMCLEVLGLGLILHAPITTGAVLLIFIPTLAVRLKIEETALIEKFGKAYAAYRQTTPLLFPWRLPSG